MIVLWKNFNNIEYDIIGIIPKNIKLDLEQKELKDDCLVNILFALNFDIPLVDESKVSKVNNSTNHFKIKNNNQTINNKLCFQMLDIDIY